MPEEDRKRNIALVEKMYDCFNRGDLQTIKDEVFASDLVWRLPVEVHRGHGTTGGAALDALNCTHYRVRDDRISHVQVSMSDQYSADNFFWEVNSLAPIPQRLGV
jgi:hypothetical protein